MLNARLKIENVASPGVCVAASLLGLESLRVLLIFALEIVVRLL